MNTPNNIFTIYLLLISFSSSRFRSGAFCIFQYVLRLKLSFDRLIGFVIGFKTALNIESLVIHISLHLRLSLMIRAILFSCRQYKTIIVRPISGHRNYIHHHHLGHLYNTFYFFKYILYYIQTFLVMVSFSTFLETHC